MDRGCGPARALIRQEALEGPDLPTAVSGCPPASTLLGSPACPFPGFLLSGDGRALAAWRGVGSGPPAWPRGPPRC